MYAENDESITLLLQLLSIDLMTQKKPRRVMETAGLLAMCYSRQGKQKEAQLYIKKARDVLNQLKSDTNLQHFEIIEAQSVLLEAGFLSGQRKHDDAIKLLSSHLQTTKELQFEGKPFIMAIQRELILSRRMSGKLKKAIDTALSSKKSTVDIAFLMDGTASMGSQMNAAKEKTTEIIHQLQQKFPDKEFRIGFVLYRDKGEGHTSHGNIRSIRFSANAAAVTDFIRPFHPHGGDDPPEDIVGGFEAVLSLDWEADTRVLIHFADAPCHGSKYHSMHDDYPNGVSGQPEPEVLLR